MEIFSKSLIGVFDFNIDNIDFENPLFLEGNKYLPIASLLGTSDYRSQNLASFINRTSREREIAVSIMDKLPGMNRIFSGAMVIGHYTRKSIRYLFDILSKDIGEYIEASPNVSYSVNVQGYSRTSYVSIANSMFSTKFTTYYLQSMRALVVGKGTIIHGTSKSLLMGIVFDARLLKYHKLYFLTHGKFDYANMEFWINCDIDTPQYPYKGFRKMYRNIIKPTILELGMKIVEKGDVDASLRVSFNVPQNSIAELVEWKHNLFIDFLKEETEEMTFQF